MTSTATATETATIVSVSSKSVTRTLAAAKSIAKSNKSALVRAHDIGTEIAVAQLEGVSLKSFANAWVDRVAAWTPNDAEDAALKLAVVDFGLSSKGTLSKYATIGKAWNTADDMLAELDANSVPRTWTAAYKYLKGTADTATVSDTETGEGEDTGEDMGVDTDGIPMVTDAEALLALLVDQGYSVKSCQLIAQALVQLTSNMKGKGKG